MGDDPYYPSSVRLVRGAGAPVDGDAYDPEQGTSMQQLLRARRRQTLFGGSGRVSHSQVQSLQPPPEPPPPTEDELLMAALLQRRDKGSAVPAAAAVGSTPSDVQQQPPAARPEGAWTARHEQLLFDYRSRHRGLPNSFDEPRALADATAATGSGNVSLAPVSSVHAVADGGSAEDVADGAGARVHDGLSGLSHLRFLQPTEATETKATLRAQRRSALRGSTDAVLEPVERLLNALTPKELHPEPQESSRRLQARLTAAEAILKLNEEALSKEVRDRASNFSDESMGTMAVDLARGVSPSDIDELRNLCKQAAPPLVIQLLGRCVATLLSADTAAEAERAAHKASGRPLSHGPFSHGPLSHGPLSHGRPLSPTRGTAAGANGGGADARGRGGGSGNGAAPGGVGGGAAASVAAALLSWEEARLTIVRADLKTRLLHFDPRCVLTMPHVMSAVRACVDRRVTSTMPMHPSVRTRDHSGRKIVPSSNAASIAALHEAATVTGTGSMVGSSARGAGATCGTGAGGGAGGGATAVLTYEDAKFVSQSATVFIVWLARVFGVVERLEREWHEATLACRKLEGAIDDARHHVEVGCTPSIPGLPLNFYHSHGHLSSIRVPCAHVLSDRPRYGRECGRYSAPSTQ
jgi:hypothetical protein